jgi:hypothetical protein
LETSVFVLAFSKTESLSSQIAISIVHLTFPRTWTAILTVSSTTKSSLYSGQEAKNIDCFSQYFSHNSSDKCGANGLKSVSRVFLNSFCQSFGNQLFTKIII